ncbi:hypothetical protein ACFWPQ_08625 [Streptomyces sp. NPDC058464]|uniref:hypothetical protein n=1 Tax=Streptomyces sp. NPDC058464 TaxID=3346511 RepID=UPI00365368B2
MASQACLPNTPGDRHHQPPQPEAGTPLRARVRRPPPTWFFALAMGMRRPAWTPYILSGNGLGVWHWTFPGSATGSQLLGGLPGAYLGPIASALFVTGKTAGPA